ncbi:MAG: hypothetical protein WD711_11215 [Dongiaceae bacterium]
MPHPLLIGFAVERTVEMKRPGQYCPERNVWVVVINGITQPLVEARLQLSELITKTKVERERDDEDYRGYSTINHGCSSATKLQRVEILTALCELSTKTERKKERDD